MSKEQEVQKVVEPSDVKTEIKTEVKPEIKTEVKTKIENSEIKKKRKSMPPRPDASKRMKQFWADKRKVKDDVKISTVKKISKENKVEVKKSGKSAIYVFIAFILMILVIGGFVIYKRFKESKKQEIIE